MIDYFQLILILLAVVLVVSSLSFTYGRYIGIKSDLEDAYSCGWLDCEDAIEKKIDAIYSDHERSKLKDNLWIGD